MKRKLFYVVTALLISAGIAAQNQNQQGSETKTQTQQQTGVMTQTQQQAGVMTQTQEQTQYQNQGQLTRAQKRAERQAKKQAKKEAKMQAKAQKGKMTQTQQGVQNKEKAMSKTSTQNKGASRATPQKNAVKVSKGGAGKR